MNTVRTPVWLIRLASFARNHGWMNVTRAFIATARRFRWAFIFDWYWFALERFPNEPLH